jgi:hypothetical protein
MKPIFNKILTIKAYIAFAEFVAKPENLNSLITKLELIEKELKQGRNTDKGLWFRFFNGDTAATTINNLKYTFEIETPEYLKHSTAYKNKEYMIENICIALNEISLQIYYS